MLWQCINPSIPYPWTPNPKTCLQFAMVFVNDVMMTPFARTPKHVHVGVRWRDVNMRRKMSKTEGHIQGQFLLRLFMFGPGSLERELPFCGWCINEYRYNVRDTVSQLSNMLKRNIDTRQILLATSSQNQVSASTTVPTSQSQNDDSFERSKQQEAPSPTRRADLCAAE